MTTPRYIDTDAALADFCQSLGQPEFIAVDTEFIREKTYFPQLCLIQVADAQQIACIDPFPITDFEPLLALFRDPAVVKVLHSVSQDMEIFLHHFNCLPAPVYDTQIAATLSGLGEQVAYAKLVHEMLGVSLDKAHSRTDWSKRPLDTAQLDYAADDVRYLAQLYPQQRRQLEQQGRLDWLGDDFAELSKPARYQPDPAGAWRKVKGANRLRGVDYAVLKELAEYREQAAVRADRPKRFIIGDDLLVDIARSKPKTIKDMEGRRGFNPGLLRKHGEALLACIQRGLALPQGDWPEPPKGKPLTAQQEILADILMGLVKMLAHRHGLSPSLLANRKAIERLARGKRDIELLHGWRYEHGGRDIIDFLQGNSRLQIIEQQLELQPN